MEAQRRTGVASRLRALALLITCVCGLTLVTAAHSSAAHKPAAPRVAVLAVTSADVQQLLHRADQPAGPPLAPPVGAPGAGPADFANSSLSVSSRTAHTPQVRGPPGHALA
jgi:hypothetical protein